MPEKVYVAIRLILEITSLNIIFTECSHCVGRIAEAIMECLDLIHFDQVECTWDLIGADFQCIICFCEVISEIGAIFGQDWGQDC